MTDPSLRLVLDSNVVLRGLISTQSVCGKLLAAVDRRAAVILLSKSVLGEYRAVLSDSEIVARYPELIPHKVEVALRRFRFVSEYVHPVSARFQFDRDPRDSKFIELAIAGRATHLITFDHDLLTLASGYTDAAKRFRQRLPRVQIMDVPDLLNQYSRVFEIE